MRQRWRKGEILTPRSARGPGDGFASAPTPCEMPPERGPTSTTPTAGWAPEVGWPARSDVRPLPSAVARGPRRRPGLAEPDRSGRGAFAAACAPRAGLRPLARVEFTAAVRGLQEACPLGRFLVGGER